MKSSEHKCMERKYKRKEYQLKKQGEMGSSGGDCVRDRGCLGLFGMFGDLSLGRSRILSEEGKVDGCRRAPEKRPHMRACGFTHHGDEMPWPVQMALVRESTNGRHKILGLRTAHPSPTLLLVVC